MPASLHPGFLSSGPRARMHVCARSGELLGVTYNLSNVSQGNPCEQQLQGHILLVGKKKLNALGSKKNLIDTYELLHIIKKHHQVLFTQLPPMCYCHWLWPECVSDRPSPHPSGIHILVEDTDKHDNAVRKSGYSGGQDAMGTGSKNTQPKLHLSKEAV